MNKDDLLKHIAETAYNVGFGAKKHFATFDIVAKAPGLISFISLAFGIYALVIDSLNTKLISATLIIIGVIGLYISFYDSKKNDYAENGRELTDLFNELKRLYGSVKGSSSPTVEHLTKLEEIERKYTQVSSSQQILFGNWYAHYKFFWEQQIEWIDEQKKFSFWRDKIPLSFSLLIFTIIVVTFFCASNFSMHYCNWLIK
ncbi:MAG: SLATT domain-containing protein [Methylotenera sp.]|nr:SLATT domain-containing protein [Methylotenera sp.]MDD4926965.1 SLATT domain-containing protein [Methylotenera sp.]